MDSSAKSSKRRGSAAAAGRSGKKPRAEEPIKVVHFSDPIYVMAAAWEFKSRVQELTGRSSTVADDLFVEVAAAATATAEEGCSGGVAAWDVGLPLDLGLDDAEEGGLFGGAPYLWEPQVGDAPWLLGAV